MTQPLANDDLPDILTDLQTHVALYLADVAKALGKRLQLPDDDIHDTLKLASVFFWEENLRAGR